MAVGVAGEQCGQRLKLKLVVVVVVVVVAVIAGRRGRDTIG